ncbi:hypothetical protein CC86DRAFT_410773 [Ophiobolus disseminans]|uniref:Uncharacterized protein n=1 Tax=Ophiobolus disseminans TaxID=1469910 RepID=A0A6A6ZLZ1_9PLEO|nr:hypothetical protein CC86DRAFT_410773 [Ophiobolus disseminans]
MAALPTPSRILPLRQILSAALTSRAPEHADASVLRISDAAASTEYKSEAAKRKRLLRVAREERMAKLKELKGKTKDGEMSARDKKREKQEKRKNKTEETKKSGRA